MSAAGRKCETVKDHLVIWDQLQTYREQAAKAEQQQRQQALAERVLEEVPLRFRGKSFDDYEVQCPAQANVKKVLVSYVMTFADRLSEGSPLIFHGTTGTGKTMLAWIMYQCLVKQGHRAEFQPSLHFLRQLQEKQFSSYAELNAQFNFYKGLPFLIIDEATEGCGKNAWPADWERHLLRMLIDVRYQAKRCTLIITNRSKQELIDRLGEPTIDRLIEQGITLAFSWKSHRQE